MNFLLLLIKAFLTLPRSSLFLCPSGLPWHTSYIIIFLLICFLSFLFSSNRADHPLLAETPQKALPATLTAADPYLTDVLPGTLIYHVLMLAHLQSKMWWLFWVAPHSIGMWVQLVKGYSSQSGILTFSVSSTSSLMYIECMDACSMKEKEIRNGRLLVLFTVGDSKLAFRPFTTVRSWTLAPALWERSCLEPWAHFASSCPVGHSNLE